MVTIKPEIIPYDLEVHEWFESNPWFRRRISEKFWQIAEEAIKMQNAEPKPEPKILPYAAEM